MNLSSLDQEKIPNYQLPRAINTIGDLRLGNQCMIELIGENVADQIRQIKRIYRFCHLEFTHALTRGEITEYMVQWHKMLTNYEL